MVNWPLFKRCCGCKAITVAAEWTQHTVSTNVVQNALEKEWWCCACYLTQHMMCNHLMYNSFTFKGTVACSFSPVSSLILLRLSPNLILQLFLNWVHGGCAWFLKLFLCGCLYVYVCVSAPRVLITSGMIWTPNDWLNQFYSCFMAIVVSISLMGMPLA